MPYHAFYRLPLTTQARVDRAIRRLVFDVCAADRQRVYAAADVFTAIGTPLALDIAAMIRELVEGE